MSEPLTRRDALQIGVGTLVAGVLAKRQRAAAQETPPADLPAERPYLTPASDFRDVSRGSPLPHSLKGEALVSARLTPETWRLEIVAEDQATMAAPRRMEDGTALDFAALLALGKTHGVQFLKAMQCNNIPLPLGQGLWEGVPLRDVLNLCGPIDNARRLFYWGFHNNDPKQMFRSSLAMNQVFDTPPGELPPFVAYRLNGEAIPLVRGGPVRMVVPWAHGFKSVKWLQKIVLTNGYQANDTYAERNNDPESNLKTAAYFDDIEAERFASGQPLVVRGTAMVGWPGLERVEYWLRPDAGTGGKLSDSDPAWGAAVWQTAVIDPPPRDWGGALPGGVLLRDVWGFGPDGKPNQWPLRFSIAHWTLSIGNLPAGKYELRVRTIDKNGFAQPLPRSGQRSGRNLIQCKLLTVA
jgi:DMSO/TMAO reductase YedYZ molybdopterin-dependent catalytic subunit